MNQSDWVGDTPPAKPFKDIRSTRPTVAEEKAELVLRLGRLCLSIPDVVRNGSVNKTREWLARQKTAKKLAGNSRASVQELTAAISNMERFK